MNAEDDLEKTLMRESHRREIRTISRWGLVAYAIAGLLGYQAYHDVQKEKRIALNNQKQYIEQVSADHQATRDRYLHGFILQNDSTLASRVDSALTTYDSLMNRPRAQDPYRRGASTGDSEKTLANKSYRCLPPL